MSYRICGSRLGSEWLTIATFAIVAIAPGTLIGQSPAMLIGKVTAETGMALIGADVAVDGTQLRTKTDDRGEFRLAGVPAGSVAVRARRLGFRPEAVRITVPGSGTETLDLQLSLATQDLRPVLVRGQRVKYSGRLAGYYERLERRTSGVFVTRDQIVAENPRSLTQLLERVPNVSLQRLRGGAMGVRMRDRTCSPLVWLDGTALSSGETDLDGIEPSSLEGVELYLGSTTAPARYSWTRNLERCGTILLWSRAHDTDPPSLAVNSPSGLDSLVAALAVFTADQVDKTATLDAGVPLVIPYPPSLYAGHIRGLVVAEFVVDVEGRVERGTFGVVSSTHPLFSEAVRQSITRASFTPAMRGGAPVRQIVHQPFEFTGVR